MDFYDAQVVGLGDEFAAEVEDLVSEVMEYPEIGKRTLAGVRQMTLRRFPFSLIYQVRTDQIVIVAVAHQRRKPGYWRDRV